MTESRDPAGAAARAERIPDAAIQELAARIAARFHPHRIILFGSYARAAAAQAPAARSRLLSLPAGAAEHLKAMLQEKGAAIPKTHDLEDLLDLLLPDDSTLAPLRRGLSSLSRYAVEYRYPGVRATSRRTQAAVRHADRVRHEVRTRLGLAP